MFSTAARPSQRGPVGLHARQDVSSSERLGHRLLDANLSDDHSATFYQAVVPSLQQQQ